MYLSSLYCMCSRIYRSPLQSFFTKVTDKMIIDENKRGSNELFSFCNSVASRNEPKVLRALDKSETSHHSQSRNLLLKFFNAIKRNNFYLLFFHFIFYFSTPTRKAKNTQVIRFCGGMKRLPTFLEKAIYVFVF